MTPWYVEFFASGDYARLYRDVHEPARSLREARAACALLGLSAPARVLDLCCGAGRHTRALRSLGHRAAGFDLDARSLREAQVPCARGDMRALPFSRGAFDAAISLFSSFGYLESDAEDERVLGEAAAVLRAGGALVLDLLNRENALCGFVETQQRTEEDGTLVVERRRFDPRQGRLTVSFVLAPPEGEQRESVGHSLRLYTLTELERMLARQGFVLERVAGALDGGAYRLDSTRMIAVARRR